MYTGTCWIGWASSGGWVGGVGGQGKKGRAFLAVGVRGAGCGSRTWRHSEPGRDLAHAEGVKLEGEVRLRAPRVRSLDLKDDMGCAWEMGCWEQEWKRGAQPWGDAADLVGSLGGRACWRWGGRGAGSIWRHIHRVGDMGGGGRWTSPSSSVTHLGLRGHRGRFGP